MENWTETTATESRTRYHSAHTLTEDGLATGRSFNAREVKGTQLFLEIELRPLFSPKELRPRPHKAQKIIDDITTSENAVKEALERVRQNPGDPAALEELRKAEEQFNGIKEAFDALRRRNHGN